MESSQGKGESSEDTKKKVMELMKPGKEKVKVMGVRKRKEGGLIIVAAAADYLRKSWKIRL